jgi:beta-glucanase (GH16 family)
MTTLAQYLAPISILAFTAAALHGQPSSTSAESPSDDAWQLVWADEFDYEGLPDESKWDYEHGFVRGEELQYYTKADPGNAWVTDGVLTITADKEYVVNEHHVPGSTAWQEARPGAEYTSASLMTRGKADWLYGRLEMRAKLPRTPGAWPAFWTLGANWIKPHEGTPDGVTRARWPQCGEIDILEYYGSRDLDTITANVHYPRGDVRQSRQMKLENLPDLDAFHTYAVEWDTEKMDFYFDGEKWYTFELSQSDDDGVNPFRRAQFILLNLALEKKPELLDKAEFPMEYVIDYVRVYQREPSGDEPVAAME